MKTYYQTRINELKIQYELASTGLKTLAGTTDVDKLIIYADSIKELRNSLAYAETALENEIKKEMESE